ncbi:hypothetical protein ACET3Z_030160 [Daucus carota]
MASKHGSPIKNETNSVNEDDVFSPLISIEDSDHESEIEVGVDITLDENSPCSSKNTRDSAKNSRSSHHTSPSSSESSSNLFQMDTKMFNETSTIPDDSPKSEGDCQSPNKKEISDRISDISSKSKEFDNASPIDDSSLVSHLPDKLTSQTMSEVQLPPRQVMERHADYDPNRIPASVFGNRPSSAMEWSVTSNDSLFSLNFGSNSFSRDQFLMSGEVFDEDNRKSGELYDSGELNKPGEANRSGLPPLSPIGKLRKIRTMDADKKIIDVDKKPSMDEDINDHFEKRKCELDGNGNSSMTNRPSDASATSSQSFAFPILVDTSKYTSMKGSIPRKQDPKLDVYSENPQMKIHKKKFSSHWQWCCCCCYCCSQPKCSCFSSQHCWCWRWFKKWCCCCCCCDHSSSPKFSSPRHNHSWSWKSFKKWCCCCC